MPTKAELKVKGNQIKPKLRTGDKVLIISGKDKGQRGVVAAIDPLKNKALVVQEDPENPEQFIPLNAAIKHKKARQQGEKSARLRIPMPINVSNLMLLDPENNEPTRVGRRREDGKLVRYAKKTDTTIVDGPTYSKEEKE
jgi:large subunit ribosomal protein L24